MIPKLEIYFNKKYNFFNTKKLWTVNCHWKASILARSSFEKKGSQFYQKGSRRLKLSRNNSKKFGAVYVERCEGRTQRTLYNAFKRSQGNCKNLYMVHLAPTGTYLSASFVINAISFKTYSVIFLHQNECCCITRSVYL